MLNDAIEHASPGKRLQIERKLNKRVRKFGRKQKI